MVVFKKVQTINQKFLNRIKKEPFNSDENHTEQIVEYKYRKYLDDRYINVLLKKIAVLERELKAKAVYQKARKEKIFDEEMVYEEKIGKSR